MRSATILLNSILLVFPFGASAQDSDKLLLDLISNERISYDIGLTKSYKTSTDKLGVSIEIVHISSFSLDSLIKRIDKVELIRKIVALIDDPHYDWGANLVLYFLTQKNGLKFIIIENREDWIKKFKHDDAVYRRSFLEGIEYMTSQRDHNE